MSEVEICQLAYVGDFEILKVKLEQNPQLAGKKDQSGRQAIHWAASGGHTQTVDYLLENFPVNCDVTDEAKWGPLMIAVSAGREQITRNLIAKGASVNCVNSTGQCSLHYAASKDRYQLAELLLEHGADPNLEDWVKNSPLHRAVSKGHVKMTKLLLSYNTDCNIQDSEGNSALHLACMDEQPELAKMLVEHGASLTLKNKAEERPIDLAPSALSRQLESLASESLTSEMIIPR